MTQIKALVLGLRSSVSLCIFAYISYRAFVVDIRYKQCEKAMRQIRNINHCRTVLNSAFAWLADTNHFHAVCFCPFGFNVYRLLQTEIFVMLAVHTIWLLYSLRAKLIPG